MVNREIGKKRASDTNIGVSWIWCVEDTCMYGVWHYYVFVWIQREYNGRIEPVFYWQTKKASGWEKNVWYIFVYEKKKGEKKTREQKQDKEKYPALSYHLSFNQL